jgi:hypothetical protein
VLGLLGLGIGITFADFQVAGKWPKYLCVVKEEPTAKPAEDESTPQNKNKKVLII